LKGIAMKRIATTLLIVTLASTATAATAAVNQYGNPISGDNSYPASVPDEYSLASEFPNMVTYKEEHKNDPVPPSNVSTTGLNQYGNPISGDYPYPASVPNSYSLASEFPNMVTYEDEHRNDPVTQSNTPTSPYSVPDSVSMADEGLVPGISGVPPYDNRGTHR
jgi:hypothetical protein